MTCWRDSEAQIQAGLHDSIVQNPLNVKKTKSKSGDFHSCAHLKDKTEEPLLSFLEEHLENCVIDDSSTTTRADCKLGNAALRNAT